MLEGTQVRLRILSPTIDDPITRAAVAAIENTRIEFDDSSFFDLDGDPYRVVAAQFDIAGSQIRYGILDYGGVFTNVDDRTGFNGWALSFAELRANPSARIANVEILAGRNTLELPSGNVSFNRDSVFVNVDGISFSRGEELVVQLGFRLDGGRGADVLEGDMGRDILKGRGGNDLLFGAAGHDSLMGDEGADLLFGGTGRDRLMGGAANDRLFGGTGRDLLMGGSGNDALTGGRGADVFVFADRGGRDVVRDFEPHLAGERIDLRAVAAITGYADLRANHLSSSQGDAVIALGGAHRIILNDVAVADLTADDFLF